MNEGQGAKQQIVERIKQSSNILVTVNADPSVDELSAALGLTIMLNNLNKHATAVVSGAIPPAITFLDPQKTFENTVDSLRDFIIALDKEKADHLRYKVDGDVVKIFITPYKTTISQDDLDFSQGDYNVEVVLALGVKNKDHLDRALEAHGRILHDATVATVSCGNEGSELGSIDWHEPGASSISEMLVSLSEALKGDKPVLDEQISTAFLTGIVAATDRFSNNKTSSKVMTMAAQLMAAGANQQLIAAKLEEAHEIGPESDEESSDTGENSDGTTDLSEDKPTKVNKKQGKKQKEASATESKAEDGSLSISHEKDGDVDAVAKETAEEAQESAAKKAEEALASQLETVAPASPDASPSVADLQKDLAAASAEVAQAASQPSDEADEPALGGTLNATTEQAAEDKRREEQDDRNKTILRHGGPINSGDSPVIAQPPINAAVEKDPSQDLPGTPLLPPLPPTNEVAQPVSAPAASPVPTETLADLDKKARAPHEDAMADVEAAYTNAPFNPANQPTASVGAQPLGGPVEHTDVPAVDTSNLPPLPDFTAPLPPPPPLFDQPAASAPASETVSPQPTQTPPATSSEPVDPNQFKIPGQS